MKQYEEALELIREAVEKQLPEVIIKYNNEWLCPSCGETLDFNNKKVGRCKCGKALIFEEGK